MAGVDTTKTRDFWDFRGFEKTATLSQACPGQDSKKKVCEIGGRVAPVSPMTGAVAPFIA